MRKILISILIVLLLVVGYLVIFKGLAIFGVEVLSVEQIKNKNSDLDSKLQKVSTLTSVDAPKAISDLENSAKQLVIAKDEYNNKVLYSSSENIAAASQTRPYETEYLWAKLGKHAKDNKINLKIELRQTTGVAGEYDIFFTLTGSYVSISEFISSIENDSSLKFKIENFKLIPNGESTENLQATFIVKTINVKVDNVTNPSTNTTEAETKNTNTNTATES